MDTIINNISSYALQSAWKMIRCSLAYAEDSFYPLFEKYHLHDSDQVYRNFEIFSYTWIKTTSLLILRDLFDLAEFSYVGYSVYKTYKEKTMTECSSNKERFLAKLVLRVVFLVGLTAIFIHYTPRKLFPQTNLNKLMQKEGLPSSALQSFSASWHKPFMDKAAIALIFARSMLKLYHCYLKKSYSKALPLVLLDALTLYKLMQNRIVRISHTYTSSALTPLFKNSLPNFALDVKKVETIFHLNVNRCKGGTLGAKIKSIYEYSSTMFEKSYWSKYWLCQDQSGYSYAEFDSLAHPNPNVPWAFSTIKYLTYGVFKVAKKPPAPFNVRLLHEGEVWQPFYALNISRLIPSFFHKAKYVPLKTWVTVNIW